MIGRAEALATLKEQLQAHRLLTIAGPGGIGKTTLALALAEECAGRYRQGVVFVDLTPDRRGQPRGRDARECAGRPVHSAGTARVADAVAGWDGCARRARQLRTRDRCSGRVGGRASRGNDRQHPGHEPRATGRRWRTDLPARAARAAVDGRPSGHRSRDAIRRRRAVRRTSDDGRPSVRAHRRQRARRLRPHLPTRWAAAGRRARRRPGREPGRGGAQIAHRRPPVAPLSRTPFDRAAASDARGHGGLELPAAVHARADRVAAPVGLSKCVQPGGRMQRGERRPHHAGGRAGARS